MYKKKKKIRKKPGRHIFFIFGDNENIPFYVRLKKKNKMNK